MRYFIVTIIIALLLSSCNKFDHQNIKEIPTCTYCNLADSIEGSYTGYLVEITYDPGGFNYGNGSVYDTASIDSITVYIDRTFEGLNYYEDSTVFKFTSSHFYDEIFLSETSIQYGVYLPNPSPSRITQVFTYDKRMIFSRETVRDLGPFGEHWFVDYQFIGYKNE
jgi:hypothetical protein